jgi:hypothetical protein
MQDGSKSTINTDITLYFNNPKLIKYLVHIKILSS